MNITKKIITHEEGRGWVEEDKREEWEEAFDKIWGGYPRTKEENTQGLDALIKSFIHSLLEERTKEVIEEIQDFDVTSGLRGQPVSNPLMNLEDVKRFIIDRLRERYGMDSM